YLNKAIEIDSTYSKAWFNMGTVYRMRNNFDEAIESYKNAINSNPHFAKAWFFMGIAYFDKKDYNKSVQSIEKAIELEPSIAQEVNSIIKEFKTVIEKLKETFDLAFINEDII
ncbi:MAG: tetratricopeptide repeat protein, partial [Promethearchaeota archaeon]